MRSVGNIKKITKTMEMVSISKMRRSVDKALSSRTYSHYALELLINLSKDETKQVRVSRKIKRLLNIEKLLINTVVDRYRYI